MTITVVLGFDFGTKKIGAAVGNAITGDAQPLALIPCKNGNPDWEAIQTLIKTWAPDALIIGIPVNIEHPDQTTQKSAENFCAILKKKFNLPIYTTDERLSTAEARTIMAEMKSTRCQTIPALDSIAAQIIVQQWLAKIKQ